MNDSTTSTTRSTSSSQVVYVGTYTNKGSEGIYRFRLNRETAELEPDGLAAEIKSPSFLALSPDGKFLYCCSEISDFEGKRSGGATSFAVEDSAGKLTQINQAPSGGTGPCYVSVTPDGRGVLLANYTSGSASLLPVNPETGKLEPPSSVAQHTGSSIVKGRQEAPHAHCFMADPTGKWALAVDLGIDQVIAYRLAPDSSKFDADSPVVTKSAPGAGPRHIAFHPNRKFAFVSNELNNTATAYTWDSETGKLNEIQSITTLPDGFNEENTTAEVLVHPNGKFLYVSNRGHNSVVAFTIDPQTGCLETVGHAETRGDHPRGMRLSPDGAFLLVANQNSDSLVVYRVNEQTGLPEFASEYKGISRPTAFQFLP